MDTVGILSILEGEPYERVRRLWKYFETKYDSVGVRSFEHPNVTFQEGKTEKLPQLLTDFQRIASTIGSFEIKMSGLEHFGKKVIYIKVRKSRELIRKNEMINRFLEKHCDQLFESYFPEKWIPHITIAMNDLTGKTFDEAWNEFGKTQVSFKQKIQNICIVKQDSESSISLVKRYELPSS